MVVANSNVWSRSDNVSWLTWEDGDRDAVLFSEDPKLVFLYRSVQGCLRGREWEGMGRVWDNGTGATVSCSYGRSYLLLQIPHPLYIHSPHHLSLFSVTLPTPPPLLH